MDTRQLGIFISVAESLNFTAAAQKHFMTQPAISHQISELEQELGAKLFVRTTHHVSLTSSGEEFLAYAKSIMETVQHAKSRIFNISHGKTGHLKLLTTQTHVETTARCLSLFREIYPGIQVDADVVTGIEQMNAIENGSADIIISFSSLIRNYSYMSCRVIANERYALMYRPGVLPPVTQDDLSPLADFPFVCELRTRAPFLTDKLFALCRARGLDPVNVHWCDSGISVLLILKSGLGFSLTPASDQENFVEGLEQIPLEGDDAVSDCAIGWRRDTHNQAVKFFLDAISRHYPDPEGK